MSRVRRVGAHRTPTKRVPRWMIALGALAVVIVLTTIGLFLLDRLRPIEQQTPAPAPTQGAAAVTDPSTIDPSLNASITVLDSTGAADLAAGVAQALSDRGWSVDASGAASELEPETVVWIDDPELAAIAAGIVTELGVGTVAETEDALSGSRITIVLGEDAPGSAPSVEPSDDGEIDHESTPTSP